MLCLLGQSQINYIWFLYILSQEGFCSGNMRCLCRITLPKYTSSAVLSKCRRLCGLCLCRKINSVNVQTHRWTLTTAEYPHLSLRLGVFFIMLRCAKGKPVKGAQKITKRRLNLLTFQYPYRHLYVNVFMLLCKKYLGLPECNHWTDRGGIAHRAALSPAII